MENTIAKTAQAAESMKLTEEQIQKIAELAATNELDFSFPAFDRLRTQITWAWENWPSDILATYYEGEKPDSAPKNFTAEWVVNELENNEEEWQDLVKECIESRI